MKVENSNHRTASRGVGSSLSTTNNNTTISSRKTSVSSVILVLVALCLVVISLSMVLFHNSIQTQDGGVISLVGLQRPFPTNNKERSLLRHNQEEYITIIETMEELRARLAPSIWTVADRKSDPAVVAHIQSHKLLNATEQAKGLQLCGKFLYSTIQRAVQVEDMGHQTFVATGDIDSMWTRDSAVQMGIYYGRMGPSSRQPKLQQQGGGQPYLRLVVEGAIRRQAFNIIQDPYANAYSKTWHDPAKLELKQRVIGRGGWVDTRNYEVDSGAYFFTQLYDFYVAENVYRPDMLLAEPVVFEAVLLMVQTFIVEQNHDRDSPYRYFELPKGGKGLKTVYTGMTWSGFRPSDDKCKYGYLVPSNIHAAAGLERILELNQRIWKSKDLEVKATQLLRDIEGGIQKYAVLEVPARSGGGMEKIYAYEVDGLGNSLTDFDDANVPSLLSIPLLGWTGYDKIAYQNTRARLLDPQFNSHYFDGPKLRGMGSPHTPGPFVWPLALAIEALTEEGPTEHVAEMLAFQVKQSLMSACNDAMHEGVHSITGCRSFSRPWFEWANAMFVVLIETTLGQRCDAEGRNAVQLEVASPRMRVQKHVEHPIFYENKFQNDHKIPEYYQGIEAKVKFV